MGGAKRIKTYMSFARNEPDAARGQKGPYPRFLKIVPCLMPIPYMRQIYTIAPISCGNPLFTASAFLVLSALPSLLNLSISRYTTGVV